VTARTYADAVGVMREWINSRTATLVGVGHPLQQGAHLKRISGGAPAAYAYLEEGVSFRSMLASMSAQIYADTREAAGLAATALAEELSTQLEGRETAVTGALIYAVDDIQGPAYVPDGDRPRLLLNWTVRIRPA
jgi:hypothetical protein